MNCGLDLMYPAMALDACLAVIRATPNWPQLLAYGVASAASAAFVVVMIVWVIAEALRRVDDSDQTLG